jgi:FAD/FMN-containing dehydrogenase/Fe-S oxidoreductase
VNEPAAERATTTRARPKTAGPPDDVRPLPSATDGHPSVPRIVHADRVQRFEVDTVALYDELASAVDGEVRLDRTARLIYSTDASNYRQIPVGVVLPRHAEDVLATLRIARRHGVPILGRGGGTSLAGQCCNAGLVVDFSKYMNRILEIDPARRRARVEPGVILDDLRKAAGEHGLTFGPDPATHSHCTLGGMIGNNSCGVHSVMAGRTVENVDELDVVTYDGIRLRLGPTDAAELERRSRAGGREGEIFSRLRDLRDRHADEIRRRFPRMPRRSSGFPLEFLLPENGFHAARAVVGTESTCVLVLEAVLRLVPAPKHRALIVLGYDDVFAAGDDVPRLLHLEPIGLEGLDEALTRDMERKGLHTADLDLLPEGKGWLLMEFGGETASQAEAVARRALEKATARPDPPRHRLLTKPERQQAIWEIRESGLGATAHVPGRPETWPGWEDAAVPPQDVGAYLREFRNLLKRYRYDADLYGHFGDGCIHCRIDFDLDHPAGIQRYRDFVREAARLVVSHGGSLSGEHGDGQSRGELLAIMFGESLVGAFREFKAIWDPEGRMNPGKVVDPYRNDENLRLDGVRSALSRSTHFRYPSDNGKFDEALRRCVGVGKCRRTGGGTMCPSFLATREEQHTTRGRARALFELMRGDSLVEGWGSEAVRETLDLCLSCKGCKSECPVNVDMATYRAEFLAHYYEHHARPRSAWAMGRIATWSRLAGSAPRLVNRLLRLPGVSKAARDLAGVASERAFPRFAPRRQRRRARIASASSGRPVILWIDTFHEAFHPAALVAARELLEGAGYAVRPSPRGLCCGRPLYDYGFLDRARWRLERALDALTPAVDRGVEIVGLEPSCVSVFRDELPNLLGDDSRASRVAKAVKTLSEFIADDDTFPIPALSGRALVQIHCHQRSVLDGDGEIALLRRAGLEVQVPEPGCCGMAGAFGFESEKYGVSMRIAERGLLPGVRAAAGDTVLVADGFSCREQILQGTGRQPRHLAEVLRSGARPS